MHRKFQAKQTAFLRHMFLSNNDEKYLNEGQQRLPQTLGCGLGRFVRLYNDPKYPHRYLNMRIRRRRRKFHLKNISKINILTPFATSHILQRGQRRGTSDLTNQHAKNIMSFLCNLFIIHGYMQTRMKT